MLQLIECSFETSFFVFNEKFYLQIDGTNMGCPSSPALANVVMYYILKRILGELPFPVPFLKLYVDDTLLAVPEIELNNVLEFFNNKEVKIQFRMKKEVDNRIAFLDVMIIRSADGFLRTSWYSKTTSSGRLLNFRSNHPTSQKISVAMGLITRAMNLSHPDIQQDNIDKAKKILNNNNYPPSFVNMCFEKFNRGLKNNVRLAGRNTERRFYYFRSPFRKGSLISVDVSMELMNL